MEFLMSGLGCAHFGFGGPGATRPMTLNTQHPIRQGIGVLLPLEAFEPLPSC